MAIALTATTPNLRAANFRLSSKEGFPQGSLPYILLFIVQMGGLKLFLPQRSRDVLASLHVDELAISVRSCNCATAENAKSLSITLTGMQCRMA